jgi:receptor protein-tyrosine kinase
MSIIERVAELLGPVDHDVTEKSSSKLSGGSQAASIERAVNESAEILSGLEAREPAVRPTPGAFEESLNVGPAAESSAIGLPVALRTNENPVALESSYPSATVPVDQDHLRGQGIVPPDGGRTPVAECIRLIKSQLLMNVAKTKSGLPGNVIMITSSVPGEGKSFTAINLAISIAQDRERSVLLVDADVAKPSVPSRLGIKVERGLMDALDQGTPVEKLICKLDIGNLSFLPAGTSHRHATELLASDRMHSLVNEMAERFRDGVVIFDSPPLLAVSESSVLANHMGQIVVVVEASRTPESVLLAALGRIDTTKVAGLVLNKGQGSGRVYGYGYGYGYGNDADA